MGRLTEYLQIMCLFGLQIRREFKAVVSFETNCNSLMDDWPQWRSKIFKLGNTESSTRPNIKKLVDRIQESDKEGLFICIAT